MELNKLFKGLIIFQLLSVVAIVMVLPDDPVYEEAIGIIDIVGFII